MLIDEGETAMLNPLTVKDTVVECERDPVDPVTVTVYVPGGPTHERVDEPDPYTVYAVRGQ